MILNAVLVRGSLQNIMCYKKAEISLNVAMIFMR